MPLVVPPLGLVLSPVLWSHVLAQLSKQLLIIGHLSQFMVYNYVSLLYPTAYIARSTACT